ncbi:MAG TPA: phage tail protein [Rhizobiaceae bacterium]
MVKTPRTRHSNTTREPVTIELGPDDVSHVPAEGEAQAEPAGEAMKEDIGASESVAQSPDEAIDTATASETRSEPTPEPAYAFAEPEPVETRAADSETAHTQTSREEPAERAQSSSAGSGPRAAAAPPAPAASRGVALAAGVAGGFVALVAGGLLQYSGVFGTPGAGGTPVPAIPASVETDIASLKSEVEGLKAASGDAGDVSGRVDGLSQAIDQLKTDLASLRQAVESGSSGGTAGVEALDARIAQIENRINAIGPAPEGVTPEDIAAINEKIAGLEALANASREAGSTVDSRLGAIEQSVAALSGKVDSQAQQPKVALAIAASALKAAIERGSPFESELETLAAVAPQAPGLAELRPYAQKGIATRAEIVAETGDAAKAMIAAANPPSEDADFFERLLSSAESLVEVRPIGAVEGPGVPETVARMEVAVQAGDLPKALAEFDTLPEPVKAAGAPFADKIRARIAAEQFADQAIAAAMQAP